MYSRRDDEDGPSQIHYSILSTHAQTTITSPVQIKHWTRPEYMFVGDLCYHCCYVTANTVVLVGIRKEQGSCSQPFPLDQGEPEVGLLCWVRMLCYKVIELFRLVNISYSGHSLK